MSTSSFSTKSSITFTTTTSDTDHEDKIRKWAENYCSFTDEFRKKSEIDKGLREYVEQNKKEPKICEMAKWIHDRGDSYENLKNKMDEWKKFINKNERDKAIGVFGDSCDRIQQYWESSGLSTLFGSKTRPRDQFEVVRDKKCCCGIITYKVHDEITPLSENAQYLTADQFKVVLPMFIDKVAGSKCRLLGYNTKNNKNGIIISILLSLILIPALTNVFNAANLHSKSGKVDIFYDITLKKNLYIVMPILLFYLMFFTKLACIFAYNSNKVLMLIAMLVNGAFAAAFIFQFNTESKLISQKGVYRAALYERAFFIDEQSRTDGEKFIVEYSQRKFSCCSLNGYKDFEIDHIKKFCFKNGRYFQDYLTKVTLEKEIHENELRKWCKPKGCKELIKEYSNSSAGLLSTAKDIGILIFLTIIAPIISLDIPRDKIVKFGLILKHFEAKNVPEKERVDDVFYVNNMDKMLSEAFLEGNFSNNKLNKYMDEFQEDVEKYRKLFK